MLEAISNFFGRAPTRAHTLPTIQGGQRVYAVGDIHGRLDLFEALIERIEADDAAREPMNTQVILLGDLVDRGPDSAGVIAAARDWRQRRPVRILAGNHEEMFLRAMADPAALRQFLRVGGKETLLSYGIDRDIYRDLSIEELHRRLPRLIPQADIAFMQDMESLIRIGDYVFVHAGIDPERDLDRQKTTDLRWIREPFLSHPDALDVCVIHGHTIRNDVEIHAPRRWPNRIGIDTGAFRTGKLTAVGLQGTDRWFMESSSD